MTGYTLAPMKDLHSQGRVAHVQLLMHQGVGSAVIVALDLDVVIDVDARFLPFGERVAVGWQAAQRRPVERLEPGAAAALELAKSAGIEPVQQFRDRGVQIGQVEERAFAQDGQDPPFHQKHTRLGLRLVPGFAHARRNDSDAVMSRHLLIGRIQVRFVPAGTADRALQVVGDNDLGHAPKKLQCTDVRANPTGQLLAPGRFGERVIAGAQDRNEDGRVLNGSRLRIDDRDGVSRIVDEQFFSGAVFLPQNPIELPGPLPVEFTEPTVGITVRVRLPVLLPEQL